MKQDESPLSVQVIYTGSFTIDDKRKKEKLHGNPFYEVVFITAGKGILECNHKLYKIKKGDILIYNKNQQHRIYCPENQKMNTMFFAIKSNPLIDDFFAQTKNIISAGDDYDKLYSLFSLLIKENKIRDKYFKSIAKSLVEALLYKIMQISSYRGMKKKAITFSTIKSYLDSNFNSQFLLKDACKELFVTPSYLSRLFKENLGITPIKYINQRRCVYAKELLTNTALGIDEISKIAGFNDQYYFSRRFKKTIGKTPTQYRHYKQI